MLRLTDFRINTSHLAKIRTVNGRYIINRPSKVKVEINDVYISKSLWLLEKIF